MRRTIEVIVLLLVLAFCIAEWRGFFEPGPTYTYTDEDFIR
jgi:hypothetical protein